MAYVRPYTRNYVFTGVHRCSVVLIGGFGNDCALNILFFCGFGVLNKSGMRDVTFKYAFHLSAAYEIKLEH